MEDAPEPARRGPQERDSTSMLIETRQLGKTYRDGTVALKGLDLSIDAGCIYCLLGANGAGKTTTISLLLGLTPPTSGVALLDSIDVARDPEGARRRAAYLPEQVQLYDNLSGLENLEYVTGLAGVEAGRAELLGHLERAGLTPDAAGRRASSYSKGMRQKVGIAMALAKKAKVLILDEPLSGLDPKAANELLAKLRELVREGSTVLMATHDLFRAKESADRVGIMRGGELLQEIPLEDVDHSELERIYLEHMRTA